MKVTAVKTKPIIVGNEIFDILNTFVTSVSEGSVVAVASKIVAICEGSVVKKGSVDKDELIREQAERYLPPNQKYNFTLSIKNNVLIANAGIDESNGNGYYILWPKNPQESANKFREYFKDHFNLKKVGVIIVDSRVTPLRWGVTGVAIAHSGFSALNSYIGKPDIFGRPFNVQKANVADALAVASVAVIGEGNEQTPIAIIEDVPFVQFQNRNPKKSELTELAIKMEDDLYAELLKSVRWRVGGK